MMDTPSLANSSFIGKRKTKMNDDTLRMDLIMEGLGIKKKALISGINGQDGSCLAELLINKGYIVVGIVRRTSQNSLANLASLKGSPNLILEEGDITDYSSLVRILTKHPEVAEIYNLAAQSHVATSFKQPGLTWDVTGKGCMNLLQAIVDLEMQNRVRFYQASSSEMFGKSCDEYVISLEIDSNGFTQEVVEKYQDENTKFLPQSPYAISKCAAHYAVRLYREAYGLHASAAINFNHESPRRGADFVTRKITLWIGKYLKWLKAIGIKNENISASCSNGELLYASGSAFSFSKLRLGNLDSSRDWGHASDFMSVAHTMLQQDHPDDYVICTGETHTIREFLDEAFKVAGIDDWENLVFIDPQFFRPAEVDYLRGDSNKARQKLGFQPSTSFKELVREMTLHDIENA